MINTNQIQASAAEPNCTTCGVKMRLFGIEAHPTAVDADLSTYVCTQCDGVQIQDMPRQLLRIVREP